MIDTTDRLTRGEFLDALRGFQRSAFRLELQPRYREPGEAEAVVALAAGRPTNPYLLPGFPEWLSFVRTHTSAGRRMVRVRVHDDPPNDYQRWERWLNRWNHEAGETIRYLSRQRAHDVGLLPAAGPDDWWLLDDTRLILMTFNEEGARADTDILTTDPTLIQQAGTWRDLAVRHSVRYEPRTNAAP